MRRREARYYTLAEAAEILREYGMSLRKRDGEYRVNFAGKSDLKLDGEETAYYTDDLVDAVNTGKLMRLHGRLRGAR